MSEPMMIQILCPEHGTHEHAIVSDIPGHEGAWCQMCWLESLGPSLPYKKLRRPIPHEDDSDLDTECNHHHES